MRFVIFAGSIIIAEAVAKGYGGSLEGHEAFIGVVMSICIIMDVVEFTKRMVK